MDKVMEYAPAIIEKAAKSPLGLFALMIIALSILGFFFFRTSSERTRIGMFVLMFVGVVSFGIATIRIGTIPLPPSPLNLTGDWVIDDGDFNYEARLKQVGNRISGEYDVGSYGTGTIDGLVEGNRLRLNWDQPFNQRGGKAQLKISPDGQTLTGRWNYDPTKYNSGQRGSHAWYLQKQRG